MRKHHYSLLTIRADVTDMTGPLNEVLAAGTAVVSVMRNYMHFAECRFGAETLQNLDATW